VNVIFAASGDPLWNLVLIIVGVVAGLLQALVLFILKDMKATLRGLVQKELCDEKHKTVNRRVGILEDRVGITGVHHLE
jgi:hypothetical protein